MPKPLPVALVYGDSESSQVLRHALSEIGADLVCDADIGTFNVDSLGASGADVVLISLDATIEDRLDEIYGALDEERYRVMFDDPEISNELDGWEHARWQRHLAAKLRDITDWDPPRPEGSAPVEMQASGVETASDDVATAEWMDDALAVLGEADADTGETGSAGRQADTADADLAGTASTQSELGEPELAEPELEAPEATKAELVEPEPSDEAQPQGAESAPEIPPADSEPAAAAPDLNELEAMDDAALQAELDALADADDPLAALSAMAGEKSSPIEASVSESTRTGNQLERNDLDDAASAEEAFDTSALGRESRDTLEAESPLQHQEPEPEQTQNGGPALADPPDSGSADRVAVENDTDWASLEAELNSAFDSDMLGAIDKATSADEHVVAEAPAWELQSDEDPDESETSHAPGTPSPAQSAESIAADSEANRSESPSPTETAPPDNTSVEATAASSDGMELPDVSQWALVEDDEMPLPDSAEDEQAATEKHSGSESESAARDADAKDAEVDESDADDDFGLELVDPIDYLKPEAPRDVSNELFNMPTLMPMAEAVAPKIGDEEDSEPAAAATRIERVVVLGASIGGPDAVREFLSHLPQQLPASLVLVQHLGSEFVDLMVSQLSKSSALPVRIPGRAERVVHGEVLVVPSGSQIRISADGQAEVREQDGAAGTSPSINLTMSMAAEVFGARATAIIFSGMASDAAAGALEIASRGGEVWVQDPDSCVVSNMVDEVVAAGVARFTGTPEALAHKLVAFLQETDND